MCFLSLLNFLKHHRKNSHFCRFLNLPSLVRDNFNNIISNYPVFYSLVLECKVDKSAPMQIPGERGRFKRSLVNMCLNQRFQWYFYKLSIKGYKLIE